MLGRKGAREQPKNADAMAVLASSCALSGYMEEAKGVLARYRVLASERQLSNFKERTPQFRRPEYYDRMLEEMRKAGLPE